MRKILWLVLIVALLASAFIGTISPRQIQAAAPIQIQETEISGVTAELTECKRAEGVLTVKVRFKNTSDEKVWFSIDTHHGDYDGFYVTAESKKYFVLKDSDGAPLAPKYLGNKDLNKNEIILWWAKFPAPPASVKKINLIIPRVPPFDDVPITG